MANKRDETIFSVFKDQRSLMQILSEWQESLDKRSIWSFVSLGGRKLRAGSLALFRRATEVTSHKFA